MEDDGDQGACAYRNRRSGCWDRVVVENRVACEVIDQIGNRALRSVGEREREQWNKD